ncbi:rifin PIR protein, putative [Plasmodium reichenowi]|uniref:Rifin PIR protein, putative n=1 Tax=Plasmodium reichenowi TaxID=5854 RepID=A0A2P9DSW7_PLARE|nr:rifin PIR protein, putative [Plasmodium reichenowi]
MKLHYSNILLFFISLNILVTSYQVYNKNKPYITIHHTSTTKSRVLSKCDIRSSIYDNDRDIKSVKENFDRQTAQRLREYDERMKVKRQKRKAKHDKNIKEIILKDKMEKSLAEKIETGCLKCGCGLGGVAASVGLFGGFGIHGWKTAALAAVKDTTIAECSAKGVAKVIELVKSTFDVQNIAGQPLETVFNVINYTNEKLISQYIYMQYKSTCICSSPVTVTSIEGPEPICILVWNKSVSGMVGKAGFVKDIKVIETAVGSIVSDAKNVAGEALQMATEEVIKPGAAAVESTYASCQIAIIASVVALLIIALVMIIIYLVLRYRRKKKMNKKGQYTKLLNE